MSSPFLRTLSLVSLSVGLSSLLATARASDQASKAHTPVPQIVRINLAQGDVRISRGSAKGLDLNKPWEQAVVNVPIEEGFVLATGAGRAEIEFESLTTVYVAEDSTLYFRVLRVLNGVPLTNIDLITGTVTVFANPVPSESFSIKATATNVEFSHHSLTRIDDYFDATSVTAEGAGGMAFQQAGSAIVHLEQGQTVTYVKDLPVMIQDARSSGPHTDWDKWVEARVKERQAATDAAGKASGLSSLVPGLADLPKFGSFFPCPPYGTCWKPNAQQNPTVSFVTYCLPRQSGIERTERVKDPTAPLHPSIDQPENELVVSWVVCHAGSFIRYKHHYVWVVGKRHHRPPLCWVHFGHQDGFVPRHPGDVKGKPPVNLKHGVFVPSTKPGGPIQEVAIKPSEKLTLLSEPPKNFRGEPSPLLHSVERPEIQTHFLFEPASSAKETTASIGPSMINYDYKRKGFVETRRDSVGRLRKPVVVGGITSRGEFSRTSSGRSSDSSTGRPGGGSSSGDSSRSGGSYSGGGSRSGGSYSSGGGGASHASGSGGSSGAASSSSAGANGTHH